MTCAEFADHAAELALGTLDGDVRAAAVAHADGCTSCQALVQDLSLTTDALLLLAPSSEPPLGFEDRVFDAIHATAARPSRPPRRWKLVVGLAAAAVIAAVAAIAIGRIAGEHAAAKPQLAVATLRSGGSVEGQVVVAGHQAVVTAGDLGTVTWVQCEVTLKDGQVVKLGGWPVHRGYAEWKFHVDASPTDLRSASLIGPNGQIIVTAPFVS